MRPGRGLIARCSILGGALAGALLLLTGCVVTGPSASDPRLAGTWHLASGSDDGAGLPIGGHSITLTIGDAAHTGGNEPCSSYRARVTGGIGAVFIGVALTGGTRDECTTKTLTQLEQLYVGALGASRFAVIDQGALVLSSPRSNLVFLRSAPGPATDIQNTTWRLYAIGSQVPTITSAAHLDPVYLKFIGTDDVKLSSPCLTEAGGYQLEGDNFAIGHTASVGGWCPRADRNLALGTAGELNAPLLLDVSTGGDNTAPMLVVTNLDDNLTVVFRADN